MEEEIKHLLHNIENKNISQRKIVLKDLLIFHSNLFMKPNGTFNITKISKIINLDRKTTRKEIDKYFLQRKQLERNKNSIINNLVSFERKINKKDMHQVRFMLEFLSRIEMFCKVRKDDIWKELSKEEIKDYENIKILNYPYLF